MDRPGWYGVRCVIRWPQNTAYEESITVWRAASFGAAIEKAETEARDYAATCGGEYTDLAQAFFIGDENLITDGAEVFSLIRRSGLGPDDYLTTFFDTGDEHQGTSREP
ncbi:hypothetical protein GCM10023195_21900 [Actinoallomurus liliacearum]|uniref:DUF4288 domain-containing protein n=1 Tax=Actinoallomurus liliacearum TaxID=1080073 RepID=A0ABP8TH97_9ACTN